MFVCICAHVIFSLYSADYSFHDSHITDKSADDTGLTELIMNDDNSPYQQEVDRFVDWCEKKYFVLNVGKTKEMIVNFRQRTQTTSRLWSREKLLNRWTNT